MSKARQLADLGNVYDDGALSNRNLIINGAMQVAQRGTSAVAAANTYATVDRFEFFEGTDGAYTSEQSSVAPDGFANSIKLAVTTADGTLAAGQYAYFLQAIEAQNLQHLKYGTASAESVTLSFWVRSSKTGTYCFTLDKNDTTRYNFIKEYTINSANTWEYKTITVTPDSNIKASGGAINNDNGIGFRVFWWLAAGSTFNGGADNAWTSTTANLTTSSQVNWMDSTSNDFYITGVSLEVGDSASPFEHRSYGDELARCQRYFCKSFSDGVSPSNGGASALSTEDGAFNGRTSNTEGGLQVYYPVEMRAVPTLTAYGNSSGYWYANNTWHVNAFGTRNRGTGRYTVSQQTVGGYSWTKGHWTADAEL